MNELQELYDRLTGSLDGDDTFEILDRIIELEGKDFSSLPISKENKDAIDKWLEKEGLL